MKIASVIKYTPDDDDWLSYKWPEDDIRLGSQLVVSEGQQAVFVKGGQALDIFISGTHSLSTGNLPLIDKLVNLPFDNKTPFPAEVWFINTLVNRDLLWGTSAPIQVLDKSLGMAVSLRSFGKWGIRIIDPRSFLLQLVGGQKLVGSERIYEYLISFILQSIKDRIAEVVAAGHPVLELSTLLNEISQDSERIIRPQLNEYGIDLVNFNIQSISIPDDELKMIQDTLAKVFEANQLSKANINQNYTAIKSMEILGDAANNQSDSGMAGMMQAGLGLGAGLPLGQQLGQSMSVSTDKSNDDDQSIEKLKKLKLMLEEGLITQSEYDEKRTQILSNF